MSWWTHCFHDPNDNSKNKGHIGYLPDILREILKKKTEMSQLIDEVLLAVHTTGCSGFDLGVP